MRPKAISKPKSRANTKQSAEATASSTAPLCIAGIGASAGGLAAIRDLLHSMPADSGVAFVVVQHLAPNRVSIAAELFSKYTTMPVSEAVDGARIEANHLYTSPSDKDLTIADGHFFLTPRDAQRRGRLPIDKFLTSLGESCATRAIGIVLSGAGSDGAIGVKKISECGGIVLVQKPETAEHDGMPLSAIATGLANHVLPVSQMASVIAAYARHPYAISAHADDAELDETSALKEVIRIIQGRCGYDFSGYKRGTMLRRTERRMGLHGVLGLEAYATYLKSHVDETDALFRDLLIGVTEFFRDPQAWATLDTVVIGPLVASKQKDEAIRIWVPGCSTGEEAYTLAMMVLDRVRRARKACPVQVFATDTNNDALEIGRIGKYPAGIAAKVTRTRLQRYFTSLPQLQQYVVSDELRKSVVFGKQNLFADPPFGRVDLISCRNVLIYLEPEIQRRVLNIFHFALRRDAYLFLGSAESNVGRDDLFKPVSKKFRIYKRHGSTRIETLPPPIPDTGAVGAVSGHPAMPSLSLVAGVAQRLVLDRFAPAAVMINDKYEALYFCGPTDEYLLRPRGAPTHDLLMMVREGLRARLREALAKSSQSNTTFTAKTVRMKRDDFFVPVQITVVPANVGDSDRLQLVVFRHAAQAAVLASGKSEYSALLDHLEQELEATRGDLQTTIERFEINTEKLRISNEEVVTQNEELRSINEELESSKEELQSLNEELTTVNQQLETKLRELESSNRDLENLLVSSDIATICLDESLRIKWFAPAAQRQFNFIAGDVGRNIGDVVAAIGDTGLVAVAKSVLARQEVGDKEIQRENGRWFMRRALPYKDADQSVRGVILTYTDVTDLRFAKEAARASRLSLAKSVVKGDQMRMLSMIMLAAEERERRSLAQDLHDDLGQLVSVVSLKASVLEKQSLSPDLKQMVADCAKAIEQVQRKLRAMALHLSPPVLKEMGFGASMKWLADEVQRTYNLHVTIEDDGKPKPLDPTVSSVLFRAVRELLINVAKHAHVESATVTVRRVKTNHLSVSVTDAGAGFDSTGTEKSSAKGGFGILSLRQSISLIGGEVMMRSVVGHGTTVTLKVPLQAASRTPRITNKRKE